MSKKVLLVGHSGDMYGASRSLNKLAGILQKEYLVYVMLPEKGALYDILLATIPNERILIYDQLYIFTRKSFRLSSLFNTLLKFWKNIWFIQSYVRRNKIDIVHTNSGVVPAAAMACQLAGRKHIWHIREWFGDFKAFWPFYSKYMTLFSDKIICVSETMASQFINRGKVNTIYNGFSIPELKAGNTFIDRVSEKTKKADLILGCTSRIRLIRKGQEYLIEAIGQLSLKTNKKIHLILIGDYVPGYEFQKDVIEGLISKYKLQDQVHFIGHVTDAIPYYNLFDVFVLPSGEPEPFGGVVIEAMSMGLPVIGSNLGGTTEQIKDGWNGFLFENQNSTDLSSKIEFFLNNREKIKEFGSRSRKRVEEIFSLQIHEKHILNLYRSF